jgi:hemolysin activation/secretion protein
MRLRYARLIAVSVLAGAMGPAFAAEPDASPRFDISRFDIAGNTLLTSAEADAAVAPFAGRDRDFGDVQRALDALEAAYRRRGYSVVTVRLPEQELNSGVVRLTVVQTTIGRVVINGNTFHDDANVRRSLPALQEGKVPNLRDISASLRMANENPSRAIKLSLQSAEEAIDARLDVTDQKPWSIGLNLDNSGNDATGKTHASLLLQHANLWGRDHVGSIQYTTTVEEPSKVSVVGLGYHVPLYGLGDSLDLYASYSDIDTGSVAAGLLDLTVSGKGAVYGARYNQTLARRGERDARLVYGAEIKAYKNSVLFGGQDFGNDITVRPLSIAYVASSGAAHGALTLVRNIPGGSRGGDADFERNRAGARPDYTILRFAGALTHTLAHDWQARLLVNGQLTQDALVPGEQFAAGGSTTVRGLNDRALTSDSGVIANVELYTANLCAAGGRWQCRALAFYDAATASRHRVLPGEQISTTVASLGLGARVGLGQALDLQLDYGRVIQAGGTAGGKHKLHVRMAFAY